MQSNTGHMVPDVSVLHPNKDAADVSHLFGFYGQVSELRPDFAGLTDSTGI